MRDRERPSHTKSAYLRRVMRDIGVASLDVRKHYDRMTDLPAGRKALRDEGF